MVVAEIDLFIFVTDIGMYMFVTEIDLLIVVYNIKIDPFLVVTDLGRPLAVVWMSCHVLWLLLRVGLVPPMS